MVFHEFGGPEKLVWEDVPDPAPGPDQVVIKVRAVTVNRGLDLEARSGILGFPLSLPHISGSDAAGEIVALGEEVPRTHPGLREGQPVLVMPWLFCGRCPHCEAGWTNACDRFGIIGIATQGGYAEYVAVPARNVVPLPEGVPFEKAACLGVSYHNAWHLLVTRAGLQAGETVVVVAAGSGLGVAQIQIAKLLGARVVAVAGSAGKLAKAKALGADETVLSERGWGRAVLDLTGGRGAAVVADNVGAATWPESLAALGKRGRLVTSAASGGALAQIDLRDLYRRHVSFHFGAAGLRPELEELVQAVADGRLDPVIHQVFPLEQAPDAQGVLERRENFGKVVLVVGGA